MKLSNKVLFSSLTAGYLSGVAFGAFTGDFSYIAPTVTSLAVGTGVAVKQGGLGAVFNRKIVTNIAVGSMGASVTSAIAMTIGAGVVT